MEKNAKNSSLRQHARTSSVASHPKLNFLNALSTNPIQVDAIVVCENSFILALYANSQEISCKSIFPSALHTGTSSLDLRKIAVWVGDMLATCWLRILDTHSPRVTAGFGEFPREAKSWFAERERSASVNFRCSGALLRFHKQRGWCRRAAAVLVRKCYG